jgi:hypothetical protein
VAILNITFSGTSADLPDPIDESLSDADVRRIAVEVVRSGSVPGLHVAGLGDNAFDQFVVDRLRDPDGEMRLYLRPKVPFGDRA